ncbi:secretory lipase [Fusarium albosuccineum]|uniref:Secretory lipase n=1 Tax=Fusarium albosuccineum TaxID=1237068 RepID=A0A8H4LEW0_9HYPO|nr:secretory lipase [Fusarium albosuccineum]
MKSFLYVFFLTAIFAPEPAVAAASQRSLCDTECLTKFRQAWTTEAAAWVNTNMSADDFYANPSNLSDYDIGDLVKWEDITPDDASQLWTIPAGMSLSRFFYITEDIDGKPIPATAFALLPYHNPLGPEKPLRTVVWAHGTAGGTRQCAPSNHKTLYYNWEAPFAIANQGYAVIAPDYAGQGSDIPQGFMYESGALHAGDVSHGLKAARKALGNAISKEWVVVGHSEGGLTAWRTNEREARSGKATGGFLGAVSAAPALRPLTLIPKSFKLADGGPVGDVVSIFFLQSLSRLLPSIKVEDYVTDIVAYRIALADQACLSTGAALFSSLTAEQLYKNTSWLTHPDVVDWQKRYNGVGPHMLAAPMLIVQGENDTVTYAAELEDDFNETCEKYPDSKAELLLYPGLDHDPSFQAGLPDYLAWIKARFDGEEAQKGCKKRTIKPVNDRFSVTQFNWQAIIQAD